MSQGLCLDIVHKGFSSEAAATLIEHFSLSIPQGEFCAFVGPSGCGKTTLLRLTGGLDTHFSGQIQGIGPNTRIGTLFQEARLMPWLSVLDNLMLVMPEARAQAKTLLEAVGLSKVMDQFPKTLSGGMQRRVAIARAFLVKPELLLMDEPFISLDQPTAEGLRQLLLSLWQQQRCTVLYVTHDVSEALSLADRVVFLSQAPTRILLDIRLESARPRAPAAVASHLHQLLDTHPQLLQGISA